MEGDEKEMSYLSAIYVYFFERASRGILQRKLEDEFFSSGGVRCKTEFTNIFSENENKKDVKNNIEAAPFD
jgi:hypothetical protein